MGKLKFVIAFSLLLVTMIISPAWADSQQGGEAQFSIEEIVVLTKKVEKTMAEKGVRVFIIGRNGRDPKVLPDGVIYTHVAFGVYSQAQTQDGRTILGYAYYNLYQSDENGAESKLVTDYTIDFLANVYEAKVGIVVPTPELQKRLLMFVGTSKYTALHNPSYSVMSNPNNSIYQNCTEYVLDVINASIYRTADESKLKKIAKEHFVAQDIHISPFKVFLGSMFVAGVSKSDHKGQIRTATFTTIAKYLESFNLAQEIITIEI